jgi:hypothetical protein
MRLTRDRSDSLARHIRGHDTAINKPGSRRTIFNRVSRACTNCSKSKVRCDGKLPCQHCATRNLQCIREARQKRKSKALNYSSSNAQSSVEPREIDSSSPDSRCSPHGDFLMSLPATNVLSINSTATLPSSTQPVSESRERRLNEEIYTQPTPISPPEHNAEYASYASFPSNEAPSFQHLSNGHIQNATEHGMLPLDTLEIETPWDHQHNITDWMTLDFFDPQDFFMNEQLLNTPLLNLPLQQLTHPPVAANMSFQPNRVFTGLLSQGPAVPNRGVSLASGLIHPIERRSVPSNLGRLGELQLPGHKQSDIPKTAERAAYVSFPDFSHGDYNVLQTEIFSYVETVSQESYDQLLQGIEATCDGLHGSQRFILSTFPPRTVYNCFVQLYFEYYHSVFPLIHQPTFNPSRSHWLEVLAVAAIGCRFSKAPLSLKCSHTLLWLLGRSIHQLV